MNRDVSLMVNERASRPNSLFGRILLVTAVGNVAAMRSVLSPIQEDVRSALGLTDFQISLAQGLAVALPMIFLALPFGWLIDRYSRVRLLAALTATSTFGGLLIAATNSFAILFVARLLVGFGAICALPTAISLASDLTSVARRGRMILLVSLGTTMGTAFAYTAGGWLLDSFRQLATNDPLFLGSEPWRGVDALFALMGAVLTVFLLAMGEPARQDPKSSADIALSSAVRYLWDRRAFLLPLVVAQNSVVMADTASSIWAAPLLVRLHHLRPEQFAGWMGAVVILSGALGAVVGGYLADLGHRVEPKSGLLGGALIAAVVSLPATFFAIAPTQLLFALSLGLLLFCGAITSVITSTAIASLIPNELRGICLSIFVVAGGIVGFGIAPTLTPLLAELLGGSMQLGKALASICLVVSAISVIAFSFAMKGAATYVVTSESC